MLFKPKTWMKISACLSVVLLLLGGVTIAFVDDIYRHMVNEYMVMSPQSVRYEPWRKSLYPLTFKVYLFNWTNPEEYREGKKPRLVEMGPYTYSELDEKKDLQWNDNHTVTYKQSKVWYFEPERSNGSLDDLVTTVDIVALTAATVAERKSFIFKRLVSGTMAMTSVREYSTHTVDELLFAGYEDSLLRFLGYASVFAGPGGDSEVFPHTKFGFFYKTNDSATAEGVFNMATGAGDISQTGLLKTWNHSNRTRYFPGDCGLVEGTSGEMWPPWITKTRPISLFAKGLCSSLTMEFEEEAEVEGIAGYRFVPSASNFDNGSAWPESACNCARDGCVPSGVLSMEGCRFGSPMYLSFPHFYDADPHYVRLLEGLQPDPSRHKFSIVVEPNTGVPLEIFGRTQSSLMLESKPSNRVFQGLRTTLLPVMWVEVAWRLSEAKAAELSLLVGARRAMQVACLVLLVVGAAAAVASVLLARRRDSAAELPKDAANNNATEKENKISVDSDIPMEVNIKSSGTL